MSQTVVVTGASGFIGKHIVKALLDAGYTVRGSVRSDAKADETRAAVGPEHFDRLSFVHLDLGSDEGWTEALQGADALFLVTEWNEFRRPDFEAVHAALKNPVVFDGRNIYSRPVLEKLGFTYYGVGV